MDESELEKNRHIYGLPANYNLCKKHRSGCLLAKSTPSSGIQPDYCICCDELTNGERYSMCVDPEELLDHGFGLSLLFTLFIYSIYLISFLSFFSFIQAYFSYTGGYTLPIREEDKVNTNVENLSPIPQFVARTSMGNMMRHDIYFNGLLNIGVALILFMAWATYYRQLLDKSIELDMTEVTPHDYTIMLSGLPSKRFDPDHFLRESIYTTFSPFWVVRKCFTHDITKEIKLAKKVNQLNMKISIFQNVAQLSGVDKANQMLSKQKTNIKMIMDKAIKNEEKLKGITERQYAYAQYAFLTFKNVEKAREAFLRFNSKDSSLKYKGQKIKVTKAPEAYDILWENCPISTYERRLRIVITFTVCLTISFIAGICNFRFQMWIEKEVNIIGGDLIARITSPFILDFLNMFLNELVAYFTKMEKHKTITEQEISIGIKSAIVDSVNTILIPLLVQWLWVGDSFYTQGGCCHNLFYVWILVGIIHPLAEYPKIWIWELIHYYQMKKYIKHHHRTQIEANNKWEQPEFSVAGKYSSAAFFVFLTAFGFPLFPLGSIFSIFAIGLGYWVYKHLALRICKKPPRISQEISLHFMKMFGYAIPILLFSNGLFCYLFGDEHEGMPAIIGFALLVFLYLQKDEFFGEDKLKEGKYAYLCKTEDYDVFVYGKQDYLFYNPVTKHKALEEYIKRQIHVEKGEAAKARLYSHLGSVTLMGIGASTQMYALDKSSKAHKKLTPHPLKFDTKELKTHFNSLLGIHEAKPRGVATATLAAGMMSMALSKYSNRRSKEKREDEEDPGMVNLCRLCRAKLLRASTEKKVDKSTEEMKPTIDLMQIIQDQIAKAEAEEMADDVDGKHPKDQ